MSGRLVRVRRRDGTFYLAEVVRGNPTFVEKAQHHAFGALTRPEYKLWQLGLVGLFGLGFGYALGKGA
jgi:hypothetical protein